MCVKVLKYLRANTTELDAPRFRDVTASAEAAYRSRIIVAFIARTKRLDERKKAQSHILRSMNEMKKRSCIIHTPGKRQIIPTSSRLVMMDEQAIEESETRSIEGEGIVRIEDGEESEGVDSDNYLTETLEEVNKHQAAAREEIDGLKAVQPQEELLVDGKCCIFIVVFFLSFHFF